MPSARADGKCIDHGRQTSLSSASGRQTVCLNRCQQRPSLPPAFVKLTANDCVVRLLSPADDKDNGRKRGGVRAIRALTVLFPVQQRTTTIQKALSSANGRQRAQLGQQWEAATWPAMPSASGRQRFKGLCRPLADDIADQIGSQCS